MISLQTAFFCRKVDKSELTVKLWVVKPKQRAYKKHKMLHRPDEKCRVELIVSDNQLLM